MKRYGCLIRLFGFFCVLLGLARNSLSDTCPPVPFLAGFCPGHGLAQTAFPGVPLLSAGTSGTNATQAVIAGSPCAGSGTLGTFVNDGRGVNYVLSNNHVIACVTDNGPGGIRAAIGDNITQPSVADAMNDPRVLIPPPPFVVANLSAAVILQVPPAHNDMDAAIAQMNLAGIPPVATTGLIIDLPDLPRIIPSPPNLARRAMGMLVAKSGRTTGLTFGTVTVIMPLVVVGPYATGGSFIFRNQLVINGPPNTCLPGDSGSLWVRRTMTRPFPLPQAVGLNFAGNPDGSTCFANPMFPLGKNPGVLNGFTKAADAAGLLLLGPKPNWGPPGPLRVGSR